MGKLWTFLQKRKSTREVIALAVSVVFPLVVAGWAVFTYVFPPDKPVPVSPTPTVTAGSGGIAAGRDVRDSTITKAERDSVAAGRDVRDSTVNIGIPADQLPAIIVAVTKDWKLLSEQQKETIQTLQNNLGVNQGALKAFFTSLGENDIPPEQQSKKLLEIAGHYKELLAQAKPAPDDDPQIAKIKNAAAEALQSGQFGRADQLLEQLRKLQDAALEAKQLEGADTSAQRGQLALTQLRYPDAARLFADAARRVPAGHDDVQYGYLDRKADALYREGEERGDNRALAAAIERYRALLTLRPRELVPRDWAATQNNLGIVLRALGERESGTARLDEAVAAYREALKEYTRQRVPLDWAMTQNNLGNALMRLGERESGTARLGEAAAAFREALKERTRERVPVDWAMTQNNLGNALRALGERESGTARLDEAVAAYDRALAVFIDAKADHYVDVARANWERASRLIAERRGGAK
jgi:tetratricopeptide (TPR) repeat protein